MNSSSFEQLAKDGGMADRRLYLINSRLRFLRLPINSGKSTNSLCVKSNVVNWAQFPNKKFLILKKNKIYKINKPISFGKCSRWLCATSSVNNWIRFPTVIGNERIRFSLN